MNKMNNSVKQVNTLLNRTKDTSANQTTVSFLYDWDGRRKYLTTVERRAFLAAAKRVPVEIRAFCTVLAYTGARISEVLALAPKHFDRSAQLIVFESLKKRRKGVFRAVPVPAALLRLVDELRLKGGGAGHETADRLLWDWSRTTAWNQVKNVMAMAQIVGPQASAKGLRHAFAVGAIQAGVPVNFIKRWLGHARLSTTEIYLEAVGEEEQAIAARAWKAF
jgi:integrase